MMPAIQQLFRKLSLMYSDREGVPRRWMDRMSVLLRGIGTSKNLIEERQAQVDRFKQYYLEFRRLLTANNDFLENIAELEESRA
jgi:hypothetical protein